MLPIIVLPGMDGTGDLLAELASYLSLRRSARIVAYPATEPLGYDALTAFVASQLPEGRFVILGESFSGPIAIEIAAARPNSVAALILASTFARSPVPPLFAAAGRMLDTSWLPERAIEAMLLGRYGTPALRASLHGTISTLPRKVLQRRAIEVMRVDKRERLRAITCPILYLRGRFDRIVRKRHAEEILAIQPRTMLRTLEAPHMLLETHAREAAEIIDAVCEQVA